MDEALLRKLIRQMKWLNFWVSFFGFLFIISFVIGGFLLFKVVTYIHHADDTIQNLQTKTSQTLDVQSQLCDNASLKSLLSSTGACK
jgi:hypothetical protein